VEQKEPEEPKGCWRLFHSYGCQGVVFYSKVKPKSGDQLQASDVVRIDGTAPKPGSEVFCGSCGGNVNIGSINANESTLVE